MGNLFLIGVILAGSGVALVLWQLIWTVVLNCRILQDLALNKKPRYDYEINPLKGLTDMTVFCRFVRDDEHPAMFEIVYRELMNGEFLIRVIGKSLEIIGGILVMVDAFQLDASFPVIHYVVIAFAAWFGAYLVNFVMAFIVSKFAYWSYRKWLR